jgi:hypothetical protein
MRAMPWNAPTPGGADVYPRNHPERADLIDGSIGELSTFHEGVAPETAVLPDGRTDRLIAVTSPEPFDAVELAVGTMFGDDPPE